MKLYIRNLYEWLLESSKSKYSLFLLFIVSLSESFIFPIPPDVLLIALCISKTSKSFKYALICLFGSIFGAVIGYIIGFYLWETTTIQSLFYDYIPGFTKENYERFQIQYNKNDIFIIFAGGFTPIPFKIITILSGAFKANILNFILAVTISRFARFYLIAALIWKYGNNIKYYIDKYFNILTIVLFVIIIILYFYIKY